MQPHDRSDESPSASPQAVRAKDLIARAREQIAEARLLIARMPRQAGQSSKKR